jgi:ketol-acid reductoisomerase
VVGVDQSPGVNAVTHILEFNIHQQEVRVQLPGSIDRFISRPRHPGHTIPQPFEPGPQLASGHFVVFDNQNSDWIGHPLWFPDL